MIKEERKVQNREKINVKNIYPRKCFICGAKSIGLYGGYESFIMNLLQHHSNNKHIQYYVTCKANGQGFMDFNKLPEAEKINDDEFLYYNARGFLVKVPEKLGSAQAIYYDIKSLKLICDYIEKNNILNPVVYILASRIGPFEKKYVNRIHKMGGVVYQNPDGHEDWRRKWNPLIRKYWKLSERYAVKNADLVICDSVNIEKYIKNEYKKYKPKTTYIAYGCDMALSTIEDNDRKYVGWLDKNGIEDHKFYCSVGRFVPENNFEIMIQEFMKSKTDKDFAIITTQDDKFFHELDDKLHFSKDKRIKFVGTVYDKELLKKIRENAYGYFHGHEVGGTNPSLLESLGTTNLNLLLDVGFNREVAEDAALYWNKEAGNLAMLINEADRMSSSEIKQMGDKAKKRIKEAYSWDYICNRYLSVFSAK